MLIFAINLYTTDMVLIFYCKPLKVLSMACIFIDTYLDVKNMTSKVSVEMSNADILVLTSDIVASHVSNNVTTVDELPLIIEQVFYSLRNLSDGTGVMGNHNLKPAVPIKKSITPDHIICLEDGKKLKMMKRHLHSKYGLTPDEYRQKWGLSSDYPMVAPNYANRRRDLAKEIGLGRSKK